MFGTRLWRTSRMACARPDRIGSFPRWNLLGALFRIQGVHPSPRATRLSSRPACAFRSLSTSERLTRPYSGELPACAVLSQLANIARLPRSCFVRRSRVKGLVLLHQRAITGPNLVDDGGTPFLRRIRIGAVGPHPTGLSGKGSLRNCPVQPIEEIGGSGEIEQGLAERLDAGH